MAQRIAARMPITIVAVGSSSTAGAGATSSAASYPSRLEAELKQRFPTLDVRVLNRGVSGEESPDMVARFERSVFAEQPDLIIWQMGTNTILREHSVVAAGSVIHDGVARLRASGADVILMDPQFAPKVIVKPGVEDKVTFIAGEAKSSNTDLFQRFAVMNYWHEVEQVPFETFISSDGYHMNDWSYGCIAKLLGGAIAEAATRSVNVARMPMPGKP
jgi:acyl-CoA thioesterase-1